MVRKAFQSYLRWLITRSKPEIFVPLGAISIYLLTMIFLNDLGRNQVGVIISLIILFFGGPILVKVRKFILPFVFVAIAYDGHKHFLYLRPAINVAEPYEIELQWFGILWQNKLIIPSQFLANFLHPVLDFITGVYYILFMFIFIGMAAWFYFVKTRTGTIRYSADEMKLRVPQIMWAMFTMNMMGYITYLLYPAAPPWYVDLHGFGPAILDAPPSPARTTRFDELLGVSWFKAMYSESTNVFGAVPSLHCAYPALAIFYAIKFRSLVLFSIIYLVCVCFGAVYLNHHYIIDVILGGIYALISGFLFDRLNERKLKLNPRPAPEFDRFF